MCFNLLILGLAGSSSASLHTKSYVFDRQHVFVGSLNLDPRSVVENTEIGMIIESPEIAADIAEWFDTYSRSDSYRR